MIAACSSPIKGKPKLNEASATSKDPVNLAALDSMMPGTYFATKALVQASYPIREYNSSKGQGKVLTVLIGDATSLFFSFHRQLNIDSNWYLLMEITNNGKIMSSENFMVMSLLICRQSLNLVSLSSLQITVYFWWHSMKWQCA